MKKFQPKLKNPARKHEGENILTDKNRRGFQKFGSGTQFKEDGHGDALEKTVHVTKN